MTKAHAPNSAGLESLLIPMPRFPGPSRVYTWAVQASSRPADAHRRARHTDCRYTDI
jgi:hypothetical protein